MIKAKTAFICKLKMLLYNKLNGSLIIVFYLLGFLLKDENLYWPINWETINIAMLKVHIMRRI